MEFLKQVLGEMREASIRQQKHIAENPTDDCGKLLSPISPPFHRFLRLDDKVAAAFNLKKAVDRGGRPKQDPPTDQLFDVYDELRGYGATNTQAQEILAYRFDVTPRTIQRKLAPRLLTTIEPLNGEPVLRLHVPGGPRPENPLEDRPLAFKPYLRSRLATAVWSLQDEFDSLEQACEQVAHDFGLNFERGGEPFDFGTEIVKSAVRECEVNQSGWARVPLAVCRHELGRRPRVWPSPRKVAEIRSLAAAWGRSPATIDAVSRDLGADMPTGQAVQAVAEETGLKFEAVMGHCRFRPQLGSDPSGD